MSAFELPRDDPWVARGYGQASIEPGAHPAVLVVDLQYAFTDPAFPMGGAGLVVRAVEGTARVCGAARRRACRCSRPSSRGARTAATSDTGR